MATIAEFPGNDAASLSSRVRQAVSGFVKRLGTVGTWLRSATATAGISPTAGDTTKRTRPTKTTERDTEATNIIPLRELMDRQGRNGQDREEREGQERQGQDVEQKSKAQEPATERIEINYELNNFRGQGTLLRVLATDHEVIARGRLNREPVASTAQEPRTRAQIQTHLQSERVESAAASTRRTDDVSQVAHKILDITHPAQGARGTVVSDQWTRDNAALARLASSLDQSPPTKKQLADLTHSNTAMRSAIGVVAHGKPLTPGQQVRVADAILKEVRAQGLAAEAQINSNATRESQKPARDAARISDRAFNSIAKLIGAAPLAKQQIGKGEAGAGVEL